jgi:citronellol/citronellal dehydrogenase
MKRFDLMHQINARGTFMVSKFAVPYLTKSANPHILMLSPPLDMKEKWFAGHTAYSMAKYGMSLVVLGLAGELRARGIAVNALWPRTTIATAAVNNLLGGEALMRASRKPEILADAAHLVFCKEARSFTGRFLIDDTLLAENGVTDFDSYRVDPTQPLAVDFFVPDDSPPPANLGPAPRGTA